MSKSEDEFLNEIGSSKSNIYLKAIWVLIINESSESENAINNESYVAKEEQNHELNYESQTWPSADFY